MATGFILQAAHHGSVPRMLPLTKLPFLVLLSPRSPIFTTGLLRSRRSHSRLSHLRSKCTCHTDSQDSSTSRQAHGSGGGRLHKLCAVLVSNPADRL